MEHLSRIRARLHSLSELGELVGAMRSMTATHAKEAQQAFPGTDGYARLIEHAIAGAARLVDPDGVAAIGQPEGGRRVLIAICAEHGFVGAFNSEILERVQHARQPDEELILIGSRGIGRADEMRIGIDRSHRMTTHVAGVPRLSRRICADLKAAASARLLYAEPRTGASFEVVGKAILPLSAQLLRAEMEQDAPLHHLAPADLMRELSAEYLFAEIARALMESLASESNARLRTMEAASRNIDDRLDRLRSQERIIRQDEITSDLLDVVTGAEAVRGEADPVSSAQDDQ